MVVINLSAQLLGLFTYYVIISLNSKTEFCDRRSPQLVVAIGHNIFEVNRGQMPPQFLVPEGHKILKVTDEYVICECSLTRYPHMISFSP